MKKRNLLLSIILVIITIGIYAIVWDYKVTKDLNEKENSLPIVSDVIISILFGIITLGIYWLYRQFKFFRKIDEYYNTNLTILNFILTILFLGLITKIIIQNIINKSNNE